MAINGAGGRLLAVNFHGLGPVPDHVDAGEARVWCADVGLFAALLDSIAVVQAEQGMPVRITFDDGNASDHAIALPLLADRGLAAEFFVCAGRIGQPLYLCTGRMAEMRAAGMTFGSHGWSHINWRTAPAPVLEQEIEAALGQPIDSVAIPFGSYDRRVMARLGGFARIYTSDGGFARLGARYLARNSFTTDWSAHSLIDLAAGRSTLRQRKRDLIGLIKRLR